MLHIVHRQSLFDKNTANGAPLALLTTSAAKDMMPTWKQDHIYLFIKANPTKDLFILKPFKLLLAKFCDFCLLT